MCLEGGKVKGVDIIKGLIDCDKLGFVVVGNLGVLVEMVGFCLLMEFVVF